jgi:hypothetical protein
MVGDVFQIALPDGRFAYGRVYEDAGVAIYSKRTSKPSNPPIGSRDFLFHVGMYRRPLTNGECPIVGQDPFGLYEDPWPPPSCIVDSISGGYEIYHRGKIRKATKQECKGLEIAAVWDVHHIVDRILHGKRSKYLHD